MTPKKHFDPVSLAASGMLAATAVLNIIALFLLPPTLTPVFFAAQRVATLQFVAGGILLVGISGIMAVFGPKKKKWLIMESALTVLNVFLVVYNLIMRGV